MKIIAVIVSLAFALVISTIAAERPFQTTLHVVDDEGRPVQDAKVVVAFERPPTTTESVRIDASEGTTDSIGFATLEGKTALSGISYTVMKEGYYENRGARYHFVSIAKRRWQPWNPTIEVILKRIKNPVPMYARRVETKVPLFNQPLGYDLIKSDWVIPYGQGEVADFIFEANRDIRSDRDYDGTFSIRFTQKDDGLLPLVISSSNDTGLRMPYLAPEEGYIQEKIWQESRHPTENGTDKIISSATKSMNYFFRVRTVCNEVGQVMRALYGKIHGDIDWMIGTRVPQTGLKFVYYLNPDETRNMEYDPKRNMLKSSMRHDPNYENLMP